jgi:hypothetical protein
VISTIASHEGRSVPTNLSSISGDLDDAPDGHFDDSANHFDDSREPANTTREDSINIA